MGLNLPDLLDVVRGVQPLEGDAPPPVQWAERRVLQAGLPGCLF